MHSVNRVWAGVSRNAKLKCVSVREARMGELETLIRCTGNTQKNGSEILDPCVNPNWKDLWEEISKW